MSTALQDLLDRVKAATGYDNALDIAIDVALFEPDVEFSAARANAAGTKLVLTDCNGQQRSFLATDWTLNPAMRARAIASLTALIAKQEPA